MASEFACSIRMIDEGTRFEGSSRELPEIYIDTAPPIGTDQGYGPVELLLLSLTSCMTMTTAVLLRRRGENRVVQVKADTEGTLRTQPVIALDTARIAISMLSDDVEEELVQKTLEKAKSGPSVVWARLSGSLNIEVEVTVNRTDGSHFTTKYLDPMR